MVTPRIDDTGDRATRSMNAQPVRKLLRVSSDGAKVLHDGADTIALLDAKLGGAGYLQLDTSSRRDTREQWQLVDAIVAPWRRDRPSFPNYEAGTWGPPSSDELLHRDGRSWRRH